MKGESFRKKGNHAKAQKMYLQGIEHGCVRCLIEYTQNILLDGATRENRMAGEAWKDNSSLHLVLPLLLEGAIRGSEVLLNNIIVTRFKRRSMVMSEDPLHHSVFIGLNLV